MVKLEKPKAWWAYAPLIDPVKIDLTVRSKSMKKEVNALVSEATTLKEHMI